jgi:hypothetical protein
MGSYNYPSPNQKNKISIKRLADKELRAIYSKKIIVKKNQKTPCILDKNTP